MKHRLVTLICLFGINTVQADVIVDPAHFLDGPAPSVMLITGGGLGVVISSLGDGKYEFTDPLFTAYDYRLFRSYPGQEFTPLQAGSVLNRVIPGTGTQPFLLNQTKYYAYWEQVFSPEISLDPVIADNYGWVSLTHTSSGLVISGSATALGGGIIVGTYTQIPEPATVLLFGLGGVGAWLLRRNKQDRSNLE